MSFKISKGQSYVLHISFGAVTFQRYSQRTPRF